MSEGRLGKDVLSTSYLFTSHLTELAIPKVSRDRPESG